MKKIKNKLFFLVFLINISCLFFFCRVESFESAQMKIEPQRQSDDAYAEALSTSTTRLYGKDVPDYLIGKSPGVKADGRMILSYSMSEALKKYNPNFKIRRTDEFIHVVQKICKFAKKAPYAVFGDFNGDKKKDVVIMGYNETSNLLISIVSTKNAYETVEISKDELKNYKEEWLEINPGEKEYGIWWFLTLVPAGKIIKARPEWNRPEMNLVADGFEIEAFEKASTLYVYKDGKFVSYTMSD